MTLCLGVSGGHHKSTAVALQDDTIIGCVIGESLNLHTLYHAKVAYRLSALLDKLAERIKIPHARLQEQTLQLVLALPGAATEYDQKLAELCLSMIGWIDKTKYRIIDDTWAGLLAGTLSTRGVCAFAGTGASVFVGLDSFATGRTTKMDGWGPILGDFGSGFQLAMDAFRFIGRSLDRGVVPHLFYDLLQQEPKISNIHNVQTWFDQLYILHPDDWRIKFAGLAAAVTRAADRQSDPDLEARSLVKFSAEEITKTIKFAIQRFSLVKEPLPIVFQGGMFEHSILYRETVTHLLKQDNINNVKMAHYRPVIGAALFSPLAIMGLSGKSLITSIINSIQNLPFNDQDILVYKN